MEIHCPTDQSFRSDNRNHFGGKIKLSSLKQMKYQIAESKKEKKQKKRKIEKKVTMENKGAKDYFVEMCKENNKRYFVSMFVRKLRQGIVKNVIEEHPLLEKKIEKKFLSNKPLDLNQNIEIFINLVIILQILTLFISSSLGLVFNEIDVSEELKKIFKVGLIVELVNIVVKFTTASSLEVNLVDRKLPLLEDLIVNYLKGQFFLDISVSFILLFDIVSDFEINKYLRLTIILKLGKILQKKKIIEIVLIRNCYKQQYWELVKVFIFNFLFAHVIAILLILLGKSNTEENWLKQKNLWEGSWFQVYAWSYYWSTTIMLTVGFGDFHATTSSQALWMVFIMTLSCIILTYNISTVGTIIRNISSFDDNHQTKIKIFTRMQDNFEITKQIKDRVMNHINEQVKMLKEYSIDEEQNFVNKLPTNLLEDFKKQINKKIFENLPFFRNISQKYLEQIALKIQRKLSHPNEIILSNQRVPDIVIAKGGAITLNMNRQGLSSHGMMIQSLKLKQNEYKLLSLKYLLNESINYDIKSSQYTTLYKINFQVLKQIIRSSPFNYQYYCMIKDKQKFNPNEFQVIKCQICSKQNHTLFQCPKLHYIPLKSIIIHKHNSTENNDFEKQIKGTLSLFTYKNIRKQYQRKYYKPLLSFREGKLQKKDIETKRVVRLLTKQWSKTSKKKKKSTVLQNLQNFELQKKLTLQIKEEFSKMTAIFNKSTFEWTVETDVAYNFDYYFPKYNPSQLGIEFLKRRLKTTK